MDTRTDRDQAIYRDEFSAWLPQRIVDIHVHVVLPEHCGPVSAERLEANWAMEVGICQSWEQLRENYRVLFPGQQVSPLAFTGVYREMDTERGNDYVLAGLGDGQNNATGLFVTRPDWSANRITDALAKGFVGIKPYPDLALQETQEVSIYDFLPRTHLAALNEAGGILMLHLPRAGRLGAPENITEVLEIAEKHPRVNLIVAHVGRAYCLPAAEHGLRHFADAPRIYFDVSANLNADVFQLALETVGPDRLLFGSDLPIMMMRGYREHVGEQYINNTDGPYSWNVNRKSPEEEATYTYYLYEGLRALIEALRRAGLDAAAMERIMYANGARLLGEAARR
ncbi:MAG: amidohydrolase family protein [Armatimonadota bacterium]|nr:MAG: amidohydrolase family protein [Armatimonadota bacterium]